MSNFEIEKTGEFDAFDNDGKRYRIVEYTRITLIRTIHNEEVIRTPGNKSYRLQGGSTVNALGDGKFEAFVNRRFKTPVILTRQPGP